MNTAKLLQQTEHHILITQQRFHLKDSKSKFDGSFDENDYYGIETANGVIGLANFSRESGITPVFIELYDSDPGIIDVNDYDGVLEASLAITSGKIYLENGDGTDRSRKIEIPIGNYRVRTYFANELTCIYQETQGANHARFVFFPEKAPTPIKILKDKENGGDFPDKKYKGNRSKNELIALLKSPIISYRCLATVALLQLGQLDAVKSQLIDAPLSVKRIFASSIWFAGDSAVNELNELAKNRDNDIRLRVVQSSGALKNAAMKDLLNKLSKSKNEQISSAAELALEDIDTQSILNN